MEGWVIDLVFQFLPVDDLITCALVNKEFCDYARRPGLWNMHKQRVLREMPKLEEWLNDKEDTRKVFLRFVSGKLTGGMLFWWISFIYGNEFVIAMETLLLNQPGVYNKMFMFKLFEARKENNRQRRCISYELSVDENRIQFCEVIPFFKKFINNDPKWRPMVNLYKLKMLQHMVFY